jgi:hypothetical protein
MERKAMIRSPSPVEISARAPPNAPDERCTFIESFPRNVRRYIYNYAFTKATLSACSNVCTVRWFPVPEKHVDSIARTVAAVATVDVG